MEKTKSYTIGEEIANEIADSISEIAVKQHPKEASKITGMIREMGIQKMNMLQMKLVY